MSCSNCNLKALQRKPCVLRSYDVLVGFELYRSNLEFKTYIPTAAMNDLSQAEINANKSNILITV